MKELKKPFYKKWWFWLIVIVFVGAVGSQLRSSDGDKNIVSEKKEFYEIGEVVETDQYSFVVNSVREMEPNEFVSPKEGKIIFAVDATFTNKTDKEVNITALNNVIKDSDGRSADIYIFGDNDGGLGGSVMAGEKLSGESAFEVDPEGDLYFYFETSVFGGDKIKVKVR
ncbi:DUF4352 domain-containing protein [Erysipelothrix rhusiopathiae]|nr:DUF4352 domain-containing protein [Erysipelothrix rhusiopathiae]MDE8060641.1 DUF4352 domain-containing protein [Erysipelothrix rhusiopathiae]MDE8079220.1 DUF4352 domain-containing protein [Erysipelothrix rhusiopathiae]MDE8084249.1 DUF4352 domain-containing protein [Erysipelothrix rhusiopathiae]MDE8094575.1 DUF4352 domain-containing protein [Erysipelothrix rhusiopathiae]